jgi:anti-sigma-K factor RskA
MRYQNPELRGALAAEYALGTLVGRARARFAKLLLRDADLQGEVNFWDERLAEFAARLKPVAPRDVVWVGLEREMAADASKVVPLAARQAASQQLQAKRAWLWPTWAVAATLAAVALGLGLQQQQAKTDLLAGELAAAKAEPAPYVAVLQPAGGDARWAVSLHPDKNLMRVSLSGSKMPADTRVRSLELWMLDTAGKPHSLGVLPVVGGNAPRDMPLPALPASELGAGLTLAISEEPIGGSPTGLPTGKVLGAFAAVKPL